MLTQIAQLKGGKLPAAVGSWVSTFAFVDLTTGQAMVAAFFAFVSAAMAAWLATRPAILKERNQKEQSAEDRHIRWLESRIQYHSQQVVLVRKSKHNQVNYIDSCHNYIRKAQGLLGERSPPFEFKYHEELCGDEDRGMALLTLPSEIHATQTGEMPRAEG